MYKYSIKKSSAKMFYKFLKSYEGQYCDVLGYTPVEVQWDKNRIYCFSKESIAMEPTLEVTVL